VKVKLGILTVSGRGIHPTDTKCFYIHVHPKDLEVLTEFSQVSPTRQGRPTAGTIAASHPGVGGTPTYEIYSYLLYQNFSAWWGRKAFTASNR